MKPTLNSGLSFTQRISIDTTRTISFMGEDGRVYSTPSMIRDMEQTSRDLLLEHLEPGEDSVGIKIEVSHLAPAPINDHVDITSTITEIDRRRVTFSVSVPRSDRGDRPGHPHALCRSNRTVEAPDCR